MTSHPHAPAYRLTGDTRALHTPDRGIVTLHRIAAARPLPHHGVREGDTGGWIESEHLHDGAPRLTDDAWVAGDAALAGQARMGGRARLAANATATDHAAITGDAIVGGRSTITGHATVAGRARLVDAHLEGHCRVDGDATVDGAQLLGAVHLTGLVAARGNLTFTGDYRLDGPLTITTVHDRDDQPATLARPGQPDLHLPSPVITAPPAE